MCAAWMNHSDGMANELKRVTQVAAPDIHLSCLLLDDDPIDRRYVQWLLGRLSGFRLDVEIASTLKEAAALCAKRQYDLYLLDFWMGEETSLSLVSALRADGPDGRTIVVMSSLDDCAFQDISMRSGADLFLAKQDLSSGTLERMLPTIAQIASKTRLEHRQKQLDADMISQWLKHISGRLDSSHGFAALALSALRGQRGEEAESLIADALEQISALRNEINFIGVGLSVLKKESEIDLRPFDVSALLTDVVDECRFEAEQFGKKLSFCEHVANSIILSDEGLLRELVFVLLRGALRYSDANSDIAVSYELGEEFLEIFISEFGSDEEADFETKALDAPGAINLADLFGAERAGNLLVAEHLLQHLGGSWKVGHCGSNLEITCCIPLNYDLMHTNRAIG